MTKKKEIISRILNEKLGKSLRSFSSQPIFFVDPVLCKNNCISKIPGSDDIVGINHIYEEDKSFIIKSPPQFGLTCLSRYIAKITWETQSLLWIYIDFDKIRSYSSVEKIINKEIKNTFIDKSSIKGIILDSWKISSKNSVKIIGKILELYNLYPLIVMETVDDILFSSDREDVPLDRNFDVLYLQSMTRTNIRKIVSSYNKEKFIADENAITAKVVKDMEVLNIHRTPLNCMTLLKVFEKSFDESPVNRTKLLEMVLSVLFDMENIPSYKTRPDLKDCEYVLGCFCEKIIKNCKNLFSRKDFTEELERFCKIKLIDLEVEVVFDVLYFNNIIIERDGDFCFRFSYWIYYFAAQRMHHDSEFAKYIFEDKRYVSYPEIIEFYTGIDRRRDDALKQFILDLKESCKIVRDKVGLPEDMNPYKWLHWNPTAENIEKMKDEISQDVLKSKLPDELKDKYADKSYDASKPYNQSIHMIFHEYSLVILMQNIKASSRALRNSDYVEPEIKSELLREIIQSFDQLSNVIIALIPFLAVDGSVNFEGACISLSDNFGNSFEDRVLKILQNIPFNILEKYYDDLFSHKMGPLFFNQIEQEKSETRLYLLILLLVYIRPRNWHVYIENFIEKSAKNSFYLADLLKILRLQYQYSFASENELSKMRYLIKMCIAKHELGIKKPSIDKIRKISDKNIPVRNVEN